MKYILALDIGVASVGWAVLDKESRNSVLEAGSNIFPGSISCWIIRLDEKCVSQEEINRRSTNQT